jgi:hypothetical protein
MAGYRKSVVNLSHSAALWFGLSHSRKWQLQLQLQLQRPTLTIHQVSVPGWALAG